MSSSKLKAIELLERDSAYFAEMSLKYVEGTLDHKIFWDEFKRYSEALQELEEYIRHKEEYSLVPNEAIDTLKETMRINIGNRSCSNCKFLNRTMVLLSNPVQYRCDKPGNKTKSVVNTSHYSCDFWELNG